jgi:hypothetical protein
VTGSQLKPWFAVATPQEDIREGRLEEAIFAANLWAVVKDTAPTVYLEPEAFFAKTYMTEGLGTLLRRVAESLKGGEAGDRIISLQTTFGGGKTHALVALWHLAKHTTRLKSAPEAADLRRALGNKFPDQINSVAVFTNATCDATTGRNAGDGVHTHTLWGEIAFQLGKKRLYDMVRAQDESQRVPQGVFVDVLRAASPCLILLDELADYCVGAAGVSVGDTTLADQTISFIQQLTEAVQQVPGVVVVATLPASKYEVAQSEKGQELFVTLERRFQRLGSDIKPVADEEIYEVVRRRLFDSVAPNDEPDYPKRVAEAFHLMYAQHSTEVPSEYAKPAYREQILRSYPFHPLLIDALYTRWGSHPDFQRTRGVLRLLASVVGDLWQRRDTETQSEPLIQPSHIRWSVDPMQAALTRYWGPAYQSVAAADVVGPRANSVLFDEERGGDYRKERIASGLAAAILLGSFGGQGDRSGFDAKTLHVACARPGLNWNYGDGALIELENRCFYLHFTSAGSLGKRYWFGTKANLNRLVVMYRQQVATQDFSEEILESLRSQVAEGPLGGVTWRVLVDPGTELPEQKRLTLVILPPSCSWSDDTKTQAAVEKQVLELSSKCGRTDRRFRNTLLFLAPANRSMSRLRQAYQELAALRGVRSDYVDQLDQEQKTDLERRLDDAGRTCSSALGSAYTLVLRVSGQKVEHVTLTDSREGFTDHLRYVWSTLVEDEEWILRRVGSVTLQKTGVVPESDGIQLKDAMEAFLRYTDKPMLASREALVEGVAQACREGILGIGRGPSLAKLHSKHCREVISLDAGEEGIWIIPPFESASAEGKLAGAAGGPSTDTPEVIGSSAGTQTTSVASPTAGKVRSILVRGNVPTESWADVFRSFVTPAVRMHLKELHLGIQFEMEPSSSEGITMDHPSIKSMREAAKQLGLEFVVERYPSE